jgi:hypothetical protein
VLEGMFGDDRGQLTSETGGQRILMQQGADERI